jgi:hypothetical protein
VNALFLTIDKDKNGHIDQQEFVNTMQVLEKAEDSLLAKLVVDQIYQELVGSNNLSLRLLNRKLDSDGFIQGTHSLNKNILMSFSF